MQKPGPHIATKIFHVHAKEFVQIYRQFVEVPPKRFAIPGLQLLKRGHYCG